MALIIPTPTKRVSTANNGSYKIVQKPISRHDIYYKIYFNEEEQYVRKTQDKNAIERIIRGHMVERNIRRGRYYYEGTNVMRFIDCTFEIIDKLLYRVAELEAKLDQTLEKFGVVEQQNEEILKVAEEFNEE